MDHKDIASTSSHCAHSKSAVKTLEPDHHSPQLQAPATPAKAPQHASPCHNDPLAHNQHLAMIKEYQKRFWVSLLLTIPVLILSPMIQMLFHFKLTIPGHLYVLLALASGIVIYGGWPFLQGLYQECRTKNPGMMTLIGIAIIAAYSYSIAVVFGLSGSEFFWELATLIDIMLVGHWLEMKAIVGSSQELEFLVKLLPHQAHLVKVDKIKEIPLAVIQVGDILLVKPGETVPADGSMLTGSSHINEAMLTGEATPIKKAAGDKVTAGSINGGGSFTMQVQSTGNDLYVSQVMRLIQAAQQAKSKTQNLANQAAKWLTFVALIVGGTTFIVWLSVSNEVAVALERMITVMIISCPHALGLAVPLVVTISISLAAQYGLLIRNRTAFENARKITTIVFDKTGTLTKGNFAVARYITLNAAYSATEILKIAASIEQHSEHPIATGIVKAATEKNIPLMAVDIVHTISGQGVTAQIADKNFKIVSPSYLAQANIPMPPQEVNHAPETPAIVLVNDQPIGLITLADEIREESLAAIKLFKENRIKTLMLTGDKEEAAAVVANRLLIDDFQAQTLPHQKLAIIKKLQQQGEFVAMVGDGINDAPALAQADVGIAIGSGTDIAAATADIILVTNNLKDVAAVLRLGKVTYYKMLQNLMWATGYNLITLPLAAGVLSHYGITLNPTIGAILMSLSTIIVAFNAQLLKRQAFKA